MPISKDVAIQMDCPTCHALRGEHCVFVYEKDSLGQPMQYEFHLPRLRAAGWKENDVRPN